MLLKWNFKSINLPVKSLFIMNQPTKRPSLVFCLFTSINPWVKAKDFPNVFRRQALNRTNLKNHQVCPAEASKVQFNRKKQLSSGYRRIPGRFIKKLSNQNFQLSYFRNYISKLSQILSFSLNYLHLSPNTYMKFQIKSSLKKLNLTDRGGEFISVSTLMHWCLWWISL